jgi:hypothetical protein
MDTVRMRKRLIALLSVFIKIPASPRLPESPVFIVALRWPPDCRVTAAALWDILPDSEREQWTLEPFARVGPLRFGMSPDEASAALGGIKPGVQWA